MCHVLKILHKQPKYAENTDAIRIGFFENMVTVSEDQGPAVVTISLMDGSATVEEDLLVTFSTSDIGTALGEHSYLQGE